MQDVPGFSPLYDADEMRAVDRSAIEVVGIPAAVLMERAGMAAAQTAMAHWPRCRRIAIVCGAGNNGGDGFVAARHLHEAGRDVAVLLTDAESKVRRDAKLNLAIARNLDIRVEQVASTAWRQELADGYDLILDAILGTGIDGPPRAQASVAIDAINRSGVPVLSLDIPSGVNASTGQLLGPVVRCDRCIAFHARKVGHALAPGRFQAAQLTVADIGIPAKLDAPARNGTVGPAILGSVPRRERDGSKFDAGRVLVVGGAPGMAGAVRLAATAAMRAGAGVCWAVVPEGLAPELDAAVAEVQVAGAAATPEGGLATAALSNIEAQAARCDVIVAGPGMGRSTDIVDLVRALLAIDVPLVLDADALWGMAQLGAASTDRRSPVILTPHAAELARLLGTDAPRVDADRLRCAREAAVRYGATTLLKGEDTIVCRPDGSFLVATSHRASATAGSGDVLAGAIGALMARGLSPHMAAAAGAVAHAAATAEAARDIGPEGVLAHDIAERLPHALAAPEGAASQPQPRTAPA